MLKTLNILLKLSIVIMFFINNNILAYANQVSNQISQNSYLGFDMVTSKMSMHKDYGGNIFAKTTQGINIHFGKMFNNNFGAEIGYEATRNKSRIATIYTPEIVAGLDVDAITQFELYKTTIKRPKFYLGLVSRLYI
ncbi:MAG: hypothetical protein ACR2HS_02150, partial [Gammaproteobacteria bacterium]